MKLNQECGSILARTPILKNKPIRVKHTLHARELNRWVIRFKVNFFMKQVIPNISTLATALPVSSIEPIS